MLKSLYLNYSKIKNQIFRLIHNNTCLISIYNLRKLPVEYLKIIDTTLQSNIK